MAETVLAADVGGTKTLVALADVDASGVALRAVQRFESSRFESLEAIVRAFHGSHPVTGLKSAFGVAGPVRDGRSAITNLPWVLETEALARGLALGPTALLNDFEAAALGLETLGPGQCVTLQAGCEDRGRPRVLLGAGTGLGVAQLVPEGGAWRVLPGEGGHTDFAPRDEAQMRLWQRLRARYGRVSVERVVSGAGLVAAYESLSEDAPPKVAPRVDVLADVDPAAAISAAALAGGDPIALAALDLFLDAYGAEAGNLGLRALAMGGVFVAGGIAPKVLDRLAGGGFLAAFRDKGRMRALAETVPLHVVTETRLGLYGAALAAARQG